MDLVDGLSFQIKVSFLDIGNRLIPLSKIGDFTFKYYTDSSVAIFVAMKSGSTYTHCAVVNEELVITINGFTFGTKGLLKCQMEYNIHDSILPTNPFKFYCPEQLTGHNIIDGNN